MTAADWIALVTPALTVGVASGAVVAKLARLAGAVELAAEQLKGLVVSAADHEARLRVLESRGPVSRA